MQETAFRCTQVADVTYILLCQHSSIGIRRLMNLTKRFFRLCTGVMTSGSSETIDENLTVLLRRGFRELARLCSEEPSFVLEVRVASISLKRDIIKMEKFVLDVSLGRTRSADSRRHLESAVRTPQKGLRTRRHEVHDGENNHGERMETGHCVH